MLILRSRHIQIAAITLFLAVSSITNVVAQEVLTAPDFTVSAVRLGDRPSAKAFLNGYQPRTDEGRPTYYFYNKYGTSVVKLTATSFDDPYFMTGIEVLDAGKDYKGSHFYLDKIGYFETESGIFIGSRQSRRGIAASLIIGIPVPLGVNSVHPNDVIRKKGEPSERRKSGDFESLDYRLETIDLDGENGAKFGYAAHFDFNKRRLMRYSIMLVPKK